YAVKKISSSVATDTSTKIIVTCTIVQKTDGGFHIGNATRWDNDTDTVVIYEFQNAEMTVIVTAYLCRS
ncbi:hypothetical protein GGF46_005520, partial [Coemansia sp. RSA 552]